MSDIVGNFRSTLQKKQNDLRLSKSLANVQDEEKFDFALLVLDDIEEALDTLEWELENAIDED